MPGSTIEALFLNQSGDLIWMVDSNLLLTYANQAYLKLMKEITGKEKKLNEPILVEGFGEGYIEKWTAYYTRALSGEQFELEEHYSVPETNEIKYGQIIFNPIRNENQEVIAVACQSRDITRIVKQRSEAHQLLDASLDVFCTINGAGNFVFVSDAATNHWGYSPEELIGKPYMSFIVEEDIPKTNDIADAIISGVEIKTFVNRYKRKDGDIAYNLWSARWDKGPQLMYCVARDAREKIEQEKLNNVTSKMARIGSWEVNPKKNKIFWSEMVHELHETDPQNFEPSFDHAINFYREDFRSMVAEVVIECIKSGTSYDIEAVIVTAKQNELWIRAIGNAEFVNGECTRIYGSFQDIHATKALQQQLSEILNSISDAFYAVDKDWNFTYFNKEAEHLLRKKAEEVNGKNIWQEFPAAKGTPLEECYFRVAESGQSESLEYFFPGDDEWYEINAYPSHGGVSAYFKNITERKQNAEKLEKAYEEKNSILERIGDAFFALDQDFRVTHWNKRAEEIIGIKREDLIGFNLLEKFPSSKHFDFFKQFERSFIIQTPVYFAEYFPSSNQWYEASGYPSAEGISAFFRDITDKKFAEEEILRINERFEKVTEATSDAIWDWDIENQTLFRGKGIENFFGESASKSLSEDDFWGDRFYAGDLNLIKQSVEQAIQNPAVSRWEMEYRIIQENGEIGNVIDKGIIIRNKEGKAVRMVGAMTDISDRKKHEAALVELNEALQKHAHELEVTNEQLEQFAYIASHDLQEPLRMISSFMDQLKRKYNGQLDYKAHQYIGFATDGAKRMKKIILDLLEYSKAGKTLEDVIDIDLNKILSDYEMLRNKVIAEKSVQISYKDLPIISGHSAPLEQTIHCLLDNAIKYAKKELPPRIQLEVEDREKEWQFLIKDNGIGIDPQFFEKIFIIFQRLHNREEYGGTGIGLSIAKKHVESWGGKIWLESKPGEGTIFYFTVPTQITNPTI